MKYIKIIALLSLALATPKFLQTEYTKNVVVMSVIQPNDEHPNGLVEFYGDYKSIYTVEDSDDWIVGDTATLTINDNGTPDYLDDDKIVKATYTGWIY